MAIPVLLVTIPKIFITIGILDTLKFCASVYMVSTLKKGDE